MKLCAEIEKEDAEGDGKEDKKQVVDGVLGGWWVGTGWLVAYEGTNAVIILGQEDKEIACRRCYEQ